MSENDVVMLKGEIQTLRAIVDEKWISHDKRADERWSDLMDNVHEMGRKIDGRPCHEHSEAMINLNARIKAVEGWINIAGWAIGVVYISIIGIVISKIMG